MALIALFATTGLAGASDPIGTVSDSTLASSEETSASAPATSDASLSVEATPNSDASLTVEATATSDASLTVEATATSDASLSVEASATSDASLSVEASATSDASLSVDPASTPVPGLGEPPGEPVPPPQTLLTPLTDLVADQVPAGALPDADEIVALPPPLDSLSAPSTDAVTAGLLDGTEDVREMATPLLGTVVQTIGEPDHLARPSTADRSRFSSGFLGIDGRGMLAPDGEPTKPVKASVTLIDATSNSRSLAADGGWYLVLGSVVVPRVAAESGGSVGGTSTTDLYPFAAVLAALAAAGGAGWRIFALRMPPIPTGIWLAAPVPPG